MTIKLISAIYLCVACVFSSFGQSPKGRIIFSSRLSDVSPADLYSISSDGTGERRITELNNKDKDYPAAFANRVVYRQVEDRKSQRASILITSADGGHAKPLIENQVVCNPGWSHDGRAIVYENYVGNKAQEIWVTDTNGKDNHKLIANAGQPCWSYDNEIILFTRDYNIWALDIKKGTEQKLTNHRKDTIGVLPVSSPNGKQFAYQGQFGNIFGIFIAGAKNGKIKKFIKNCGDMAWTDNPKYIVCSYMKPDTKNWEIALINIETEKKTYITNNGKSNYTPTWVNEQ